MDAKRVVVSIDVRCPTSHRTFVVEAGRLDAVVDNCRNSKSGPYACATHSHFGEGAPLNSAMILTLDLTEFEMKLGFPLDGYMGSNRHLRDAILAFDVLE